MKNKSNLNTKTSGRKRQEVFDTENPRFSVCSIPEVN